MKGGSLFSFFYYSLPFEDVCFFGSQIKSDGYIRQAIGDINLLMELLGACTVREACGRERMCFLSGGGGWAHSASSVINISCPCDTGVGER